MLAFLFSKQLKKQELLHKRNERKMEKEITQLRKQLEGLSQELQTKSEIGKYVYRATVPVEIGSLEDLREIREVEPIQSYLNTKSSLVKAIVLQNLHVEIAREIFDAYSSDEKTALSFIYQNMPKFEEDDGFIYEILGEIQSLYS